MMGLTLNEIRNCIAECLNDLIFTYNGKKSGVTSTVCNYIPTFQVWHGDAVKEYDNVDDVMNDKFYSGKSIIDLYGKVDFKEV